MGGKCSKHGKMKNSRKISVGKPERKSSLRRPRHRWEYNARMDLRETGCEFVQRRAQWRALMYTGFHTRCEFLDYLNNYWLLKKDSAPCC
jgi:hypothetical protein